MVKGLLLIFPQRLIGPFKYEQALKSSSADLNIVFIFFSKVENSGLQITVFAPLDALQLFLRYPIAPELTPTLRGTCLAWSSFLMKALISQ